MIPKAGSPGGLVPPAPPQATEDADVADPGEVAQIKVEQHQTGEGKYGSTPAIPHQPPQTEDEIEEQTSWIEVTLLDEDERPIPGEAYEITLPDGSVKAGTLDNNGFVRVDGIAPGQCQVIFPNLDPESWQ